MYVHNNDGLLDVPAALLPKKSGGRHLSMVILTEEEKIRLKMEKVQKRMAEQQEKQRSLEQQME